MGKTRNTAADSLLLRRLIFRLLPVQMLLAAMGSVNSIVDGVIAARSINPASVAVIGLHFTMVRILEAVSSVLSGGSAVLCGKYIGKGRLDQTNEVFSLNILLCLVTGGLLSALCLIAPFWTARLLGANEALLYRYCSHDPDQCGA